MKKVKDLSFLDILVVYFFTAIIFSFMYIKVTTLTLADYILPVLMFLPISLTIYFLIGSFTKLNELQALIIPPFFFPIIYNIVNGYGFKFLYLFDSLFLSLLTVGVFFTYLIIKGFAKKGFR